MLARLRYRCSADVVVVAAILTATFILGFVAIPGPADLGNVAIGFLSMLVLSFPLAVVVGLCWRIGAWIAIEIRYRRRERRAAESAVPIVDREIVP